MDVLSIVEQENGIDQRYFAKYFQGSLTSDGAFNGIFVEPDGNGGYLYYLKYRECEDPTDNRIRDLNPHQITDKALLTVDNKKTHANDRVWKLYDSKGGVYEKASIGNIDPDSNDVPQSKFIDGVYSIERTYESE